MENLFVGPKMSTLLVYLSLLLFKLLRYFLIYHRARIRNHLAFNVRFNHNNDQILFKMSFAHPEKVNTFAFPIVFSKVSELSE